MGSHINQDGKFQSDKYPTTPAGKVPLSVEDPMAQDLLWEYAQRRRAIDAEFADDLEKCLKKAGYEGYRCERTWLRWWIMGEDALQRLVTDGRGLPEKDWRSTTASFMRWLAGEELAGAGPMARRDTSEDIIKRARRNWMFIGHVAFVRESSASLHGMLRHIGYTEAEADTLVQGFRIMFPHVPERLPDDEYPPPTAETLEAALKDWSKEIVAQYERAICDTIQQCQPVNDVELRSRVRGLFDKEYNEESYAEAMEALQITPAIQQNTSGDWEIAPSGPVSEDYRNEDGF